VQVIQFHIGDGIGIDAGNTPPFTIETSKRIDIAVVIGTVHRRGDDTDVIDANGLFESEELI
jgi:hypothetical protein